MAGATGSLRSATAACSEHIPARVLALPNLLPRSFAGARFCRRTQPEAPIQEKQFLKITAGKDLEEIDIQEIRELLEEDKPKDATPF